MKICIVAHNALGAMTDNADLHIGGIERQVALLSEWLARNGHTVSVITWQEESGNNTAIATAVRVALVRICKKSDGIRFVRAVHPRWTSLIRALDKVDADTYYQNGSEIVTGQVALWCKIRRRKFVYGTASNSDCIAASVRKRGLFEYLIYKFGLRFADDVLVQTRIQQKDILDQFGRTSTILPMPCIDSGFISKGHAERSRKIVWVGRITPVKRPGWLIEIAQRAPQFELLAVP